MLPTIGRIVHYTLTEQDAEAINRRRRDFSEAPRVNSGHQAETTAPSSGARAQDSPFDDDRGVRGWDGAPPCGALVSSGCHHARA